MNNSRTGAAVAMGEVDPGGVEQLMAMGFDEDKATKALQRANNDFEEAVTIILDDGRNWVPCSYSLPRAARVLFACAR